MSLQSCLFYEIASSIVMEYLFLSSYPTHWEQEVRKAALMLPENKVSQSGKWPHLKTLLVCQRDTCSAHVIDTQNKLGEESRCIVLKPSSAHDP